MRIGMFDTHADAKTYMKNNKSLFKSSIIIDDCTNDKKLPLMGTSKKSKISETEVPSIKASESRIEVKTKESVVLEELFRQKPVEQNTFDQYSYTNYFLRLLKEDENLENSYYSNEVERIDQLIREDRYNSNIFLSATSTITKDRTGGATTEDYDTGVAINWTNRIYDGQRFYIHEEMKKIREQGAQIIYEDSKNNLAILGSDLYGNSLFSQTMVDVYTNLYQIQETLFEIIFENRRSGLGSITDQIDANDDLLELEKQLYSFETLHARNTFILKQSINSKSKKPLYLTPMNINEGNHSSDESKRLLLHNNPVVARSQNTLKDTKLNILIESSRRMPTVNLSASAGMDWNNDLITDTSDEGETYEAAISINIPIYERNDIYLNEQRAKIAALQAKNDLKVASKSALNTWDAHKKNYTQLKKLNKILKVQLKGQRDKMSIIRKQYLEGKATYRDYADALNRTSVISIDLVNNIIAIEKEKLLGNYLLGKKIYNVKN